MKEKKVFYRYCNDDVKESLYKSHRRTHHSSHTQKCPKNGCILKFKDKFNLQDHIAKKHPHDNLRV